MDWESSFEDIKAFIQNNKDITVTKSLRIIPDDKREQYYSYFDAIRFAFVKEACSTFLPFAEKLSAASNDVITELKKISEVTNIGIDNDFNWFYLDPLDGLARAIIAPTADLITGRLDKESFIYEANKRLQFSSERFARIGYLRFIQMSILINFNMTESYRVNAIDNIQDGTLGEGHENPGDHADKQPWSHKVDDIEFKNNPVISFITPEVMAKSVSHDYCIAMRSSFTEAEWRAEIIHSNMEFLKIKELRTKYHLYNIRPDLAKKTWFELDKILPSCSLYASETMSEMDLCADYDNILRPLINIETVTDDVLSDEKLDEIKLHNEAMNPLIGTYVLSLNDFDKEDIESEDRSPIRFITVGYDKTKSMPVIDALNSYFDKATN